MVGPTITPSPKSAIAVPASLRGNDSNSTACETVISAPPPRPWMIRQKTSADRECEAPQRKLAMVKRMIEPTK